MPVLFLVKAERGIPAQSEKTEGYLEIISDYMEGFLVFISKMYNPVLPFISCLNY